jgi:hypothetical protein
MQEDAQDSTRGARQKENMGAKEAFREERSLIRRLFVDDCQTGIDKSFVYNDCWTEHRRWNNRKNSCSWTHIHLRYLLSFGTNSGHRQSVWGWNTHNVSKVETKEKKPPLLGLLRRSSHNASVIETLLVKIRPLRGYTAFWREQPYIRGVLCLAESPL